MKTNIMLGENKGADQLRGNREADQRLCFRCTDSTILLLLKSEISSFWLASVTKQAGLCQTWSEPKLLVFLFTGSCNCGGGVIVQKCHRLDYFDLSLISRINHVLFYIV